MSRDRKRSLPVAGPRSRWTKDVLEGIAEGERRALARCFHRGEEGAIEAAGMASDRAADLARAAIEREPPSSPVACAKGCDACCVSKVVVVAPEVLRIADHLRRTLDPDALAALIERVRAADERTRGLSRRSRALLGVPCPLLVDGACSVHDVRPLLCRGWTSIDVSACARHFADPEGTPVAPAHEPQYELVSAVLAGLGSAAIDAGFDGALLEFNAALRIALDRKNAGERWALRLPVFSTARDGEGRSGDGEA